jgi:hypothetical protein
VPKVTASVLTLADVDARLLASEIALEWIIRCIIANSIDQNAMLADFCNHIESCRNDVVLFGINSGNQGNEPASLYAGLVAERIRELKERVVDYISAWEAPPSEDTPSGECPASRAGAADGFT